MYEFMMEKTWRSTLKEAEFLDWLLKYASRRYSNQKNSFVDHEIQSILNRITVIVSYFSKKLILIFV